VFTGLVSAATAEPAPTSMSTTRTIKRFCI
jgi:hypothetical protein